MAATKEIRVKLVPELSEDMRALLGAATEDTLRKVNAGAALVHALTNNLDVLLNAEFVTTALTTAYMQACEAYGVGREPSEEGTG